MSCTLKRKDTTIKRVSCSAEGEFLVEGYRLSAMYCFVKHISIPVYYWSVSCVWIASCELDCSFLNLTCYTCICVYFFLAAHFQTQQYSCTECDFKTHSQACLKTHHRNIHTETTYHICDLCGAKIKYMGSFIEHKRRHFGEKPFPCEECGKSFASKYSTLKSFFATIGISHEYVHHCKCTYMYIHVHVCDCTIGLLLARDILQ